MKTTQHNLYLWLQHNILACKEGVKSILKVPITFICSLLVTTFSYFLIIILMIIYTNTNIILHEKLSNSQQIHIFLHKKISKNELQSTLKQISTIKQLTDLHLITPQKSLKYLFKQLKTKNINYLDEFNPLPNVINAKLNINHLNKQKIANLKEKIIQINSTEDVLIDSYNIINLHNLYLMCKNILIITITCIILLINALMFNNLKIIAFAHNNYDKLLTSLGINKIFFNKYLFFVSFIYIFISFIGALTLSSLLYWFFATEIHVIWHNINIIMNIHQIAFLFILSILTMYLPVKLLICYNKL